MKWNERFKWCIYGFILGLFFVLVPFLIDVVFGTKTLSELIRGSSAYPVVLTAPFVLGTTFYFIGKYREVLIYKIEAKLLKEEHTRLMNMFNNFHSGIFIIDREYKVGELYNKAFLSICGNKSYVGLSIFDTLCSGFSSSMKKEVEEFLNLAFNNTTASDEMLNDFSPLKKFVYPYIKEDGSIDEKILSATVTRVRSTDDPDKIESLLFEVRDITVREKLKKELEIKEKEYEEKYALLIALLTTDKEIVKRFRKDYEDLLREIPGLLSKIKRDEKNEDIINTLREKIHSLKGEAFTLGFKGIANDAKEFEEYLKNIVDRIIDLEIHFKLISFIEKLQHRKNAMQKSVEDISRYLSELSGDAHKDAQDDIKDIRAYFESVMKKKGISEEVVEDSSGSKVYDNEEEYVSTDLLKKELELIVKKSAGEEQKRVSLIFESNVDKIPENDYKPLKEVFLHLIRNSIAHGIETPEEREKLNKKADGSINIKIDKAEHGGYSIIYSDDGRGLDTNKIKMKAVEQGLISQQEADTLNNNDVIKLIFKEGFSTSDNKDMVSGVGVGMSAIKNNIVKELRGKFKLTNYSGKGIKFDIIIPK